MIHFDNSYARLPEDFYEKGEADDFAKPRLLLFNKALAKELKIKSEEQNEDELARVFSGQTVLKGSQPIAQAYAGYQFGHPVPKLGDGRALLLGETGGYDIQLKGCGTTEFSRNGDGRSSLGPVLREFIVSEAMHALKVPTSRALAAVATGEIIRRQFGPEPGAVFTRVAESHIRVGTFQYFAFRREMKNLEILLNYSIDRHYPELSNIPDMKTKCFKFLEAVSKRQAELISKWTAVGFVHGVMNTDNFSIPGITIDYGPCAFLDEFRYHKVFSSIDHHGRYSFYNQVSIGQWNILRLADCLLPFINEDLDRAADETSLFLSDKLSLFERLRSEKLAQKLGIENFKESDNEIIKSFLDYLEEQKLDFTLAFRNLPELNNESSEFYPESELLEKFLKLWRGRNPETEKLKEINPLYIPRNHQIQLAIEESYKGDLGKALELLKVLSKPFEFQKELHDYSIPPEPEKRVCKTYCGT